MNMTSQLDSFTRIVVKLLLFCLPGSAFDCSNCLAEDHYVIYAPVNLHGIESEVVVDTGSDSSALFRDSAARSVANLKPEDKVITCPIRIGHRDFQDQDFTIVDSPPVGRKFDGILGWNLLSKLIVEFDWDNKRVTFHRRTPAFVADWQSAKIKKDASALILENEKGGGDGQILIATGSESGVGLSPALWKRWIEQHVDAPMTLVATWNYLDGPIASRQSWAKTIDAGPIKLQRVLVEEAPSLYTSLPNFEAVVGVAALYHYELIIDGPGGMLYFKNHDGCKAKVSYNRIGAVFIPDDSGSYVAHVVEHSPADRAGIRNGDTLRNINGVDATKQNQKLLTLKKYFNAKAGEEISVVICRNNQDQTIKVNLEDLFPEDK